MRQIGKAQVIEGIKSLLLEANHVIQPDVMKRLLDMRQEETSEIGQEVLDQIILNDQLAAEKNMPLCQDTGMVVVFARIGQEIIMSEGAFEAAVQEGVRQAYVEGYLRKSVVKDPLFDRSNTGDNTPAVLYCQWVEGEAIELSVVVKGFGSENMSRCKMLTPAEGLEGFKSFVLETVIAAGPNPCPPIVVGIGVGGTLDKAAQMAKEATMREIGQSNPDPQYAALEKELLTNINELGIGPAGLGGKTTALALHIDSFPGHIAGTPVVVNICCHASRHKTTVL